MRVIVCPTCSVEWWCGVVWWGVVVFGVVVWFLVVWCVWVWHGGVWCVEVMVCVCGGGDGVWVLVCGW